MNPRLFDPLKDKRPVPAANGEPAPINTNGTEGCPISPEGQDGGYPAELEPGEFPIDALSSGVRAMVLSVAEVHRVPVELPAMSAIAIVSGALGNAYTLTGAVDGKECHGNLYVLAAAPKSSGKGSVANALVRPLLDASADLAAAFTQGQLPGLKADKALLEKQINILVNELATGKTGKGKDRRTMNEVEKEETMRDLQDAHQRLEAIVPLLETMPTYWVGNATSEAMAAQFARNNPGLFCYSAEGGEIVRVMLGKYTKGEAADLDLYLSGYSVEPWRSDRIGRGVCQITPCLSMLLLVQPSILLELMGNKEAFERGMTARILYFIALTEPLEDDGKRRNIDEQTEAAWRQVVRDILKRREALGGKPHRIICSPEAREVFRQFYNESVTLRRGEFRDVEAELGRWRENAIRIAIGLCVADDVEATTLTGEQAARAVAIMRWCARSSLKIISAARIQRREARAAELHAALTRRGGEETLRNLDKCNGFEASEVRRLVEHYPERFTLARLETGGRPSDVVRITSPTV